MDRTERMAEDHNRKGATLWLRRSLWTAIVLVALWFARFAILRGMGDILITDDPGYKADVMYVLGGAPYDRGTAAGKVLLERRVPVAYCTGSSVMQSNKAFGSELTEADLTRAAAIMEGASPIAVLPLRYGTSTFEEATGILYHARSLGADTILILSTDFHTRRVGNVFRKRFEGSGITVLVHGAPSTEYDVDAWWTSEQGLLMVNNEYVKTLYYFLKYSI